MGMTFNQAIEKNIPKVSSGRQFGATVLARAWRDLKFSDLVDHSVSVTDRGSFGDAVSDCMGVRAVDQF